MTSILVVAERYWPDGGGGELATHLIVGVLSKEFDVTVITGTKNPQKFPQVNYVYEPLLSIREKPLLWLNTIKLVRTEKFKKLVKESDIIYVPRFTFPVIPFAKKLSKKVVVHLHDYIPVSYTAVVLAPYEEHKRRIARDDIFLECMKGIKYCLGVVLFWWLPKLVRKWITQADKIICVSKRQANIVADQIPELKEKMEVIYNPLPPKLLNNEPRKELDDTPTFLYVGGDSYVKGFHILLQTMKLLGRQGVKARFILTNRYSSKSISALRQLNEKYRNLEINVVGTIEYNELLKLHQKTWALIFPSIWEEPLPYAVVEAVALGTIPIAAKVGGIPEIIRSTYTEKMLFTPKSVKDLTSKMSDLINMEKDLLKDMSEKLGRSALSRFCRKSGVDIIRVFTDL